MYLLKPWINRLSHAQTTRARLGVVHPAKNVNSFDARLDSIGSGHRPMTAKESVTLHLPRNATHNAELSLVVVSLSLMYRTETAENKSIVSNFLSAWYSRHSSF